MPAVVFSPLRNVAAFGVLSGRLGSQHGFGAIVPFFREVFNDLVKM